MKPSKLHWYYRACTAVPEMRPRLRMASAVLVQTAHETASVLIVAALILSASPIARHLTASAIDAWRIGETFYVGYSLGENSTEAVVEPHFFYDTSWSPEACARSLAAGLPRHGAPGCGGEGGGIHLQWLDVVAIIAMLLSPIVTSRLRQATLVARDQFIEAYVDIFDPDARIERPFTAHPAKIVTMPIKAFLKVFFGWPKS